LYISLDANRLKLVCVKTPADATIPHPDNMQWSFTLGDSGVDFNNIERYYESKSAADWWEQ
jgi:hypothetical protein